MKKPFTEYTKEEAAEYLEELSKAGDRRGIVDFLFNTLRSITICRDSAPQETLQEDEFCETFYTANAARAINERETYFVAVLNGLLSVANSAKKLAVSTRSARTLCKIAQLERKIDHGKDEREIKETDALVAYLAPFVDFTPGTGIYKFKEREAKEAEASIIAEASAWITQIRYAREAAVDTLNALPLAQEHVYKEVKNALDRVPHEVNSLLETLKKLPTFNKSETPCSYEEVEINKDKYTRFLLEFGGGTRFVLDKIEERQKQISFDFEEIASNSKSKK